MCGLQDCGIKKFISNLKIPLNQYIRLRGGNIE